VAEESGERRGSNPACFTQLSLSHWFVERLEGSKDTLAVFVVMVVFGSGNVFRLFGGNQSERLSIEV